MKTYNNNPKENILSLQVATQEQIVIPKTTPEIVDLPESEGANGKQNTQSDQSEDNEFSEDAQELEDAIDDVELEEIKEIEKLPRAQAQGEANDGGYSDLFYASNGLFASVVSVERNLNISFKMDYPKGPYIPVLNNQQIEVQDICCVRDAPVSLTYNGILIYTGDFRGEVFDFGAESFNSEEGEGCCCEVPPAPTPNYYFTYTNCDDEAYIDFYFKSNESEQLLQLSNEYGDYSHYRLEFLPGFEPECGCDIVSVTSNVLKANSVDDITDPFVSGFIGSEGNRLGGSQSFDYGRLEYTTHFEDACGVCWSLVYFYGNESITDEHTSNYYLVPICATPVEFDTICYYQKIINSEESQYLNEYISDGSYYYEIYSNDSNDFNTIDIDVDITFVEFMGNSLLAFSFDQYIQSQQGVYGSGSNNVTLLVDVPDTMGYDSAYIDDFILCSEAYFEFFWGYIVKNSGDIFDDVRSDNILSDENALKLAKLVLATYAQNVDSPSCPLSAGVLEDTANNVYGLKYTGGSITTTAFDSSPFNTEGTYLTNVLLASPAEAGITKVDLEICYCGDSLIQRFEEFQAATGCDSDYVDPRTYIDNYVNAHFVEEGDNRYLEINYAVPVYDACNGWSEGSNETFRVCVDEEISIDKMCINAEDLFYELYNYGYIDFSYLLEDSVYFKNDEGDCYTIGYVYGDDDDDDDDDESEESYVNCDYKLVNCEYSEAVYNGKSINDVDNIYANNNYISIQTDNNRYYLNFYFIHDENGSEVQVYYERNGNSGYESYSKEFQVSDSLLDCCCKIEGFLVDENDLNNYINSFIPQNEGDYLTLDDFIYYFSSEGNFNFYDCENNCFDFYATYNQDQTTTYGVEPCDETSCCKVDIDVEYLPPEDPMISPTVAVAPADESCFDQFFNFEYISCNGLNFIQLTWYFNNYYTDDCFTFPINSDSVLISIPDDLLEVSCECPITQLILPPSSEHDYSQYFQDCYTLSNNNDYETGYILLDNLACDLAVFVSECNQSFVVTRGDNNNYNLVAIGENYIRTTTLTDENDFGDSYAYDNFNADYEYALNNGDGLSLREAVILNNHYDEEVDTILLRSGYYSIEIAGVGEDSALTGDFDILNDVSIVGGCDTVIDCNENDRGFDVQNVDLTLVNLDIINGLVTEGDGGGVSVNALSSDASLTLDNVNISGSQASLGGGVFAYTDNEEYSSFVTLKNDSHISNNMSDYGGGVCVLGVELNLYDNSSISYNKADYSGGGIFSVTSTIQLNDNSAMCENKAQVYGGGIYDAYSSVITLTGSSSISRNNAGEYGGGIFSNVLLALSLLDKATIIDNQSENAGGVYSREGELSLADNSSIVDNDATNDGGGVYILNSSIVLADNSLIGSNTAVNFGGGILAQESTITLNNSSDILQNEADRGGGIYDIGSSTITLPTGDSSTISFNNATDTGGGVYTNSTTINDPDGRIDNNSPDDIAPPLVLDLNHDGKISLISLNDSQVLWDLKGDGNLLKTGWVGPEDGLLVYDKGGDGLVTDISEFMFTLYHPEAKTDLEGLKLAFDSNHDLVFDINDDHYPEFGVWQDINGDGKTDLGEYSSLIDRDIKSISLVSDNNASLQEGNRIFGSSTYQMSDGNAYRIADVGLSVESKASLDIKDVLEPQESIGLESTTSSSGTVPTVIVSQSDCEMCLPPLPVAQIQQEPQPAFA